jgi:acyl-CoA synthetase (AMP-forming)/AMP-acid ligase II
MPIITGGVSVNSVIRLNDDNDKNSRSISALWHETGSKHMFDCVHEFFDYHASIRPDVLFAEDSRQSLSYRDARQRSLLIASRLHASGLKKGDRVALLAKNSVDHVMVYLACVRLGVVPVGLNYRLSVSEWSFIGKDAGIRMLFADAEFLDRLEGSIAETPAICIDREHDRGTSLQQWIANASGAIPAVVLGGDDIIIQMYTSGTTGRPKGAQLSHRNVVSNALQGSLTTGEIAAPADRFLLIAPLFHAAGLVSVFIAVVFGCSAVIHADYNPVGMIETLAKENIAGVTVVPVMLQFSLMMVPNIRDYDFSHLKRISYGASPISEELLRQCMDIFKCQFVQAYGQTEATAALTCLTQGDHERALREKPDLLRSCGRPMMGTSIRIVDGNGNMLPANSSGHIVAKGPQVMCGYWNNDEATLQTLKDGWLYTGDAGMLDDEGYLYIQDRIKDLIISGGENIYPAEIENVLASHVAIQDVAVIGVADDMWGEVPLAVVVAKGGERIDINELSSHCRPYIAAYKIPKHIEYVDALPRNPTGKVLKKDLRALFAQKYPAVTPR